MKSRYQMFLDRGKLVLNEKEYKEYAKALEPHRKEIGRKQACDINGAFIWSKTKEKGAYWHDIHNRIGDVRKKYVPPNPLLVGLNFGCQMEDVQTLLERLDKRYVLVGKK